MMKKDALKTNGLVMSGYVARDEEPDSMLCFFAKRPYKDSNGTWTLDERYGREINCVVLPDEALPTVKSTDSEPTPVTLRIEINTKPETR